MAVSFIMPNSFPGICVNLVTAVNLFYKLPAMSNDLTELPLVSELLWTSLFIQRMMSLLLQGQNIEMMVILIMLKAKRLTKY